MKKDSVQMNGKTYLPLLVLEGLDLKRNDETVSHHSTWRLFDPAVRRSDDVPPALEGLVDHVRGRLSRDFVCLHFSL